MKNRKKELKLKFENKNIDKNEIEELLRILYNSGELKNKMNKHIKFNIKSKIPEDLSDSDLGKFLKLLQLMRRDNTIRHSNGVIPTDEFFKEYLGYNSVGGFKNLTLRLRNYNMIKKTKEGGKTIYTVNPVYAIRKNKISYSLYEKFKKFLLKYLNKYENKLLDIKGDNIKNIKDDFTAIDLNKNKNEFFSNLIKINGVVSHPGVYIIKEDTDIIYIGKSKNIKNRLNSHSIYNRRKHKVISLVFNNVADIEIYEPYLISVFSPKLNKQFKTKNETSLSLPLPSL